MWELTVGWNGGRLATDYRPLTANELQTLLTSVGLTSAFWQFG